jgi:hypothetical protein
MAQMYLGAMHKTSKTHKQTLFYCKSVSRIIHEFTSKYHFYLGFASASRDVECTPKCSKIHFMYVRVTFCWQQRNREFIIESVHFIKADMLVFMSHLFMEL